MNNTKYNNPKIKEFTDLVVWQEGHSLVVLTYTLTKEFPKEEIYALTSQIRRAVASITSNIAEGFGRQTYKEKVQYYYLAQGSLIEFKNQLFIAKDVGYLKNDNFDKLIKQATVVHQLLQGLITKSKSFIIHKS